MYENAIKILENIINSILLEMNWFQMFLNFFYHEVNFCSYTFNGINTKSRSFSFLQLYKWGTFEW